MDPQAVDTSTSGKASLADTGAALSRRRPVRDLLTAAGLAIGLIAVILALGYFRYGDIPSFLAALRGDELFVSVQELPELADGESKQLAFSVTIKNLTMRSFRVLGINDSCNCISVEGIPATIGVRESKHIMVKVQVFADQPPTTEVALITDDAQLKQIR